MIALVKEDAWEQSNEVNFRADHVCSQLRCCEIYYPDFLCFYSALLRSHWYLLSSHMGHWALQCFRLRTWNLNSFFNDEKVFRKLIYEFILHWISKIANIAILINFIVEKQISQIIAPRLIQAIVSELGLGVLIIDGIVFERELTGIGRQEWRAVVQNKTGQSENCGVGSFNQRCDWLSQTGLSCCRMKTDCTFLD